MGFWGYPGGSALELLDGTLKLRHCTDLFTMRFHPWSLPRVGNGCGKRQFVTPGHLSAPGSNMDKRVRLTRKTRPSASSHVIPDPGHPTPRRWKIFRPPSSEGEGVEVGCLAIFFLALAAFGENRRRVPAGQASRRGWCTGTSPVLISCTLLAHMIRHALVTPRPTTSTT